MTSETRRRQVDMMGNWCDCADSDGCEGNLDCRATKRDGGEIRYLQLGLFHRLIYRREIYNTGWVLDRRQS